MYNNFYQPQQMRTLGLKGRPVSSLDEAKASAIDFDGSIFYFPDLGNNRIYTKQINLDGTASLNIYELKQLPQAADNNKDYITRQEFNEAIQRILDANKQENLDLSKL